MRNFRFTASNGFLCEVGLVGFLLSSSILLGVLCGCATYRGLGPLETDPSHHRPDTAIQQRAPGPFSIQWPLHEIKINRGFNVQKRRPHLGLDLGGRRGTGVFAAHPGKIIYSGRAYKGYGRMVMIEFSDQWATLYAHLDSIQVHTGDEVSQGQLIGRMGRSGHATGVHLHFELFHEKTPVDPLLYLRRVSP